MGGNNPRLRKSQELADEAKVEEQPAPPVASSSQRVAKKGKRRSVKQSSVVSSGPLPEPDPLPEDVAETDEEAAERAAAALERQAQARLERIEQAERDERKRRRRRVIRRTVLGFVFAVVLICAGLLTAFGIFRWQTYDDAADIQGVWYHEGTDMPVTITEDEIVLTDEVAYHYVLDPEAKTIFFRFGNMEGSGRYRFSLDRTELVITDGEFDWTNTFIDDALWTAQSLIAQYVFANETPLATGDEHETVFAREESSS